MLIRFFHSLVRTPLSKRAVRSLEFGMIAMMVAVASAGAASTAGAHGAAPLVQAASTR